MTSPAKGTAYPDGDPSISQPLYRSEGHLIPSSLGVKNSGGTDRGRDLASNQTNSLFDVEKQYLPGGLKSLSGIATRAFTLGLTFSASVIFSIALPCFTGSPLWRIPLFLAALSLFHFFEFWTTAHYNTHHAQVSSFLLSQNGIAYNTAHTAAVIECLISNIAFPHRGWLSDNVSMSFIVAGCIMIVVGQCVRSVAMGQAGTNFNHIVQRRKAKEHQLVKSGLYRYLRHPSYFGFFWWGLGTQLILGNAVCFLGYAAVLWMFFFRRILEEEKHLVIFFGDHYLQYRKETGVWIPFIR